jgi:nitrite reductase/ring-hydroxylating ferredoxin subunit/uncharacterized membrane protein
LLYAGADYDRALERLGDDERVDVAVAAVEQVAQAVPAQGLVKDALSGTWLGHALHPMLTDLPIGFWTSAFVFDLMPGKKYDDAARTLIGLGVLSAIPTAVSGAADWNDTEGAARRVGAIHALVNTSALAMYVASWRARKRGRRLAGIGWALGGATLASAGGYLGGHLVDALGIGVDNTTFEDAVTDWTRCAEVSDLSARPTRCPLTANAAAILVRHGETALAVSATCPHRGAPLADGAVDGDTITCPWHGSRFSLVDGSVQAGPSPQPLRAYDVRVTNGEVEIRERRD